MMMGEDEPGYVVKEISFGATHVGVPATGTVTIAGAHGSLTISHTGAYTYTGTSVGNDQFVYKIVDQDGDAATATLKSWWRILIPSRLLKTQFYRWMKRLLMMRAL